MKRSSVPGLKVAMEFESIIAHGDGKRDAASPKLYAVEGVSGVFKRVPRSGRGIDAPKDAVLCSFEGSIIELVMAEEVMEELAEALFPLKGDDTAHVAHLLDRRDRGVLVMPMSKVTFSAAQVQVGDQPPFPVTSWSLTDKDTGEVVASGGTDPVGYGSAAPGRLASRGSTIRMADGKAEDGIIAPTPDGYRVTSFFGVADLESTNPIAFKLCNDIPLSAEELDDLKAASKKPEGRESGGPSDSSQAAYPYSGAVCCVIHPDGWVISSPMGEAVVPINDPLARKLMGRELLTPEDLTRLEAISKKPTESESCPNPDLKTAPASTPATPTEPSATSAPPNPRRRQSTS